MHLYLLSPKTPLTYLFYQKTEPPKRTLPYICGLRARIECEPLSECSTRSDRATNIGYLLSWRAGIGWRKNYYLIPEKFVLFQVNITAPTVYFLSDYSKNESNHSPFAKLYKKISTKGKSW